MRKVSGLSDTVACRKLVALPTIVRGLIKHLRWAETRVVRRAFAGTKR
jgi:hypothetical protein